MRILNFCHILIGPHVTCVCVCVGGGGGVELTDDVRTSVLIQNEQILYFIS